ncbi:cobalt ABC transporter, ATPase subunit [Ammonifex degensii KC4]|uniref:Cobalt ABC transporter, ATPase subunit n=1 Tax=Ammonifex degensii (strain DSM 10501 / KC4) TaxID=429009 RepID=C9RCT9_AMMDK|nr:ABC transporter ATP-binding protein [Ammonifex degensii]ACX52066.1 cobalt ABC transporter, ATPase subunit [Ammonifex degensii KC4]
MEAVKVSFTYPDGTEALREVTLGIPEGKRVALIGPNGSGKTTLFFLWLGLFRPSAGEVRFWGKGLSYRRGELEELRRKVGLVFQDPEDQLLAPTVWEEVAWGLWARGYEGQLVEEKVRTALQAVELFDQRHKPPHLLSYGQKKRLCLAAVLALEPEVLLLDEPTAGLDPGQTKRLLHFLSGLKGCTIVFSTQDVDLAYSFAEHLFVLWRGRLVAEGRPAEVLAQADFMEEVGLGSDRPVVLRLYQVLKEKGKISPGGSPPTRWEELVALLEG